NMSSKKIDELTKSTQKKINDIHKRLEKNSKSAVDEMYNAMGRINSQEYRPGRISEVAFCLECFVEHLENHDPELKGALANELRSKYAPRADFLQQLKSEIKSLKTLNVSEERKMNAISDVVNDINIINKDIKGNTQIKEARNQLDRVITSAQEKYIHNIASTTKNEWEKEMILGFQFDTNLQNQLEVFSKKFEAEKDHFVRWQMLNDLSNQVIDKYLGNAYGAEERNYTVLIIASFMPTSTVREILATDSKVLGPIWIDETSNSSEYEHELPAIWQELLVSVFFKGAFTEVNEIP
ncbi:MAG TPA: hypothetical protein VIH61_09195, partial [Waddliaceae bacterium]